MPKTPRTGLLRAALFDAFRVYSDALSDPQRLERVRRYTGSNFQGLMTAGLAKAKQALTPEALAAALAAWIVPQQDADPQAKTAKETSPAEPARLECAVLRRNAARPTQRRLGRQNVGASSGPLRRRLRLARTRRRALRPAYSRGAATDATRKWPFFATYAVVLVFS